MSEWQKKALELCVELNVPQTLAPVIAAALSAAYAEGKMDGWYSVNARDEE